MALPRASYSHMVLTQTDNPLFNIFICSLS